MTNELIDTMQKRADAGAGAGKGAAAKKATAMLTGGSKKKARQRR